MHRIHNAANEGLLQSIFQVAAIDGCIGQGSACGIDEVVGQLFREACLTIQVFHGGCGSQIFQHTSCQHGRKCGFDGLAAAQLLEGLAHIPFVVNEGELACAARLLNAALAMAPVIVPSAAPTKPAPVPPVAQATATATKAAPSATSPTVDVQSVPRFKQFGRVNRQKTVFKESHANRT